MAKEKKFNLKNFPECYEISSTRIYDIQEVKTWLEGFEKERREKSKMGMDNKLWVKHHDAMWELWERAPEYFKWSHTGDKFRGFAMGYIMAQIEMLGEG